MINNGIIIGFILFSLYKIEPLIYQNKVCIRIFNNSKFEITKVSIFSIKFDNIKQGKKSKFKRLNFNIETDDSLLYLTAKSNNYALYVTPEFSIGKYMYVIDSLNEENRFIYLRKVSY